MVNWMRTRYLSQYWVVMCMPKPEVPTEENKAWSNALSQSALALTNEIYGGLGKEGAD